MKTSTTVSSALTFEIYLLGADTEQTEQMRDALHPQWDWWRNKITTPYIRAAHNLRS